MSLHVKTVIAVALILGCNIGRANAQLSYGVTDLGTLGGNTSSAAAIGGQGMNAAGMIVGSSTTSDNSEHAFLFANGQMLDLNNLCDLSQSGFKVLSAARAINDSCIIIGDGITTNGDKHAFMLTPLSMDGGRWSYRCCEWVWMQDGGGWWWEENCGCYKWHGPPGPHPPCPPQPPPCWWFIPCPPPCHRPTPTPTPTPTPPPSCWCCLNGQVVLTTPAECRERDGQCYSSKEEAVKHCRDLCWCCLNGRIGLINAAECKEKGGQCFGSKEEALRHCGDLCWCCINGHAFQVPVADCRERGGECYSSREEADRNCSQRPGPTPPPERTPVIFIPGIKPTPTPGRIPRLAQSPTPTPRRGRSPHAKGGPTQKPIIAKPLGIQPTPTPNRGNIRRGKKPTPTPPMIR